MSSLSIEPHARALLAQLAADCRTILAEVRRTFAEGLEKGRCLGAFLTEAKEQVPHGQWESWLEDEIGISRFKAHRFMSFYQKTVGIGHGDLKLLQPIWDNVQGHADRPKCCAGATFQEDESSANTNGDAIGQEPEPPKQGEQSAKASPDESEPTAVNRIQQFEATRIDEPTDGDDAEDDAACDPFDDPETKYDTGVVFENEENAVTNYEGQSCDESEKGAVAQVNTSQAAQTSQTKRETEKKDDVQKVKATRTNTKVLVDGDKRKVPEHLKDIFLEAKRFGQWSRQLSNIKSEIKSAMNEDERLFTQFCESAFAVKLTTAASQLRLSAPYLVCPYCGGTESENCTGCKGAGFLSRFQAVSVPKEMRLRENAPEATESANAGGMG